MPPPESIGGPLPTYPPYQPPVYDTVYDQIANQLMIVDDAYASNLLYVGWFSDYDDATKMAARNELSAYVDYPNDWVGWWKDFLDDYDWDAWREYYEETAA